MMKKTIVFTIQSDFRLKNQIMITYDVIAIIIIVFINVILSCWICYYYASSFFVLMRSNSSIGERSSSIIVHHTASSSLLYYCDSYTWMISTTARHGGYTKSQHVRKIMPWNHHNMKQQRISNNNIHIKEEHNYNYYHDTRLKSYPPFRLTRLSMINNNDVLGTNQKLINTNTATTSNYNSNIFQNDDNCEKFNIVIVGGGVGGLSIASRIASQLLRENISNNNNRQFQITVLEKNDHVGGRCGSFNTTMLISNNQTKVVTDNEYNNNNTEEDNEQKVLTFRHERGPSLLLLPNTYRELFQETTGNTCEYYGLHIKLCTPAYRVIFDDGDSIDVGFSRDTNNTVISIEEMKSRNKMDQYEMHGSKKWDEYMKLCQIYLNAGLLNFIEEQFDIQSLIIFMIEILKNIIRNWPLQSHSNMIDKFFTTSNKLRILASFQNLYVGLQPYHNQQLLFGGILQSTSPAIFGLLSAIELNNPDDTSQYCGVYAPIGGFEQVTNSFIELTKEFNNTIHIQCQSTVTKITKHGVYYEYNLNNQNKTIIYQPADMIIINADLPYATKVLLNDDDDNKNQQNDEEYNKGSNIGILKLNEKTTNTNIDNNAHATTNKRYIPRYDWDDQYDYSSGVIAFHWSIKRSLHELNTHNVFLVANNRNDSISSWNVLRRNQRSSTSSSNDDDDEIDNNSTSSSFMFDEPFNFYIHRPCFVDPTAAPEGMDSILVLVPCPTLIRQKELALLPRTEALSMYEKQFTKEYIDTVRDAVYRRIEMVIPDFSKFILHEVIDTPVTHANQYNVGGGTPFGLSHGLSQLSIFRPIKKEQSKKRRPWFLSSFIHEKLKNKDISNNSGNNNNKNNNRHGNVEKVKHNNNYSNVLFCGASTRPGNGVPLVLIGSKLVAKKAIDQIKILSRQKSSSSSAAAAAKELKEEEEEEVKI